MKPPLFSSILAAVSLLALAGCGGGEKPSAKARPGSQPSVVAPDTTAPSVAKALEDAKVHVPPIPAKNTKGWAGGKLAATDIAAKMDAAMKGLRNVRVVATVVGKTPKGRIMPSTFPGEIQDDRTFRISYMLLTDDVPTTGIATANGTKLVTLGEGGLSAPKKVGSTPQRDMEKLVEEWPKSFPTDVFDGLTDGGDYWSALIGAWQRGVQGFKLSVEERTTPYQDRKIKNYRVVAERPVPGPGGRVETVELVVDGQIFLPVTIRSHAWDKQGREFEYQWSAEWKNNQKLDASKFKIGNS